MPRSARILCISILLLAPALTVAQPNKPGGGNPPGGGKNPGGAKPPVMPPVGPGGPAKPGAPGGVAPMGPGPSLGGAFVVPKEVASHDFEFWKAKLNPETNRDAYQRQLAIRAMAEFGPDELKKVIHLIVARLNDPDPAVKFAALHVVCSQFIDDTKVRDRALQAIFGENGMLVSSNEMLRLAASNAASHIGPQAAIAIPILCGDLHLRCGWSYEARQAAARALGQIASADAGKFFSTSTAGPPGPNAHAIRALIERLGDPCLSVRIEIAHSLMLLGKPSDEKDVLAERQALHDRIGREKRGTEPDPTLKLWLRLCLLRIADKEPTDKDLDPIAESLRSADRYERVNAAQALGVLGPQARSKAGSLRVALVPTIVQSEKVEDQEFLFQCLWAMGQMGKDADFLLKEVEPLLNHKSPQVKEMAKDTVAKLKGLVVVKP